MAFHIDPLVDTVAFVVVEGVRTNLVALEDTWAFVAFADAVSAAEVAVLFVVLLVLVKVSVVAHKVITEQALAVAVVVVVVVMVKLDSCRVKVAMMYFQ